MLSQETEKASHANQMHFEQAVQYLLDLGHETLTIKLGLKNTEVLLKELHNPEQSFRSVQIAGTNGKGSTAVMLESICRQANIRTGLYTSPHLSSITERIRIDGADISQQMFARHATDVRNAVERLMERGLLTTPATFFEQVTAIALVAFRHAGVDLAILETGLGGRLDSTTAASADLVGITQIAFDHEEYLGDTIELIAAEKAAIIRPGTRAVIGQQSPEVLSVIQRRCEEVGVRPVINGCRTNVDEVSSDGRYIVSFETAQARYQQVRLELIGEHQIQNAAVAIQLAELLSVEKHPIIEGLEGANHSGRLELFLGRPSILLDGAHNPAGAIALRKYLTEFARRPLTIIFGAMRDKRLDEIAAELFPLADNLVLTAVNNPRAATTETLYSIADRHTQGTTSVARSSEEALAMARAKTPANGIICITGSLYLIGELRTKVFETSKVSKTVPNQIT